MIELVKRLLYGRKPTQKELDKMAQARPVDQHFSDLAKDISRKLGG